MIWIPWLPALAAAVATSSGSFEIMRRAQLPVPSCSDKSSLFTVLKKNVGKDLSTITFPVTFNEPLTLLQRADEVVEYHGLLDEAASSTDPVARMLYIISCVRYLWLRTFTSSIWKERLHSDVRRNF